VRSGPRRDFRCTLPCFDLLSQLERHPGGLRMGGLSRRMMVTGGNVTGFADQLVKEGLVTREALLDDRCAFVVRLTPAGRKALLRMAEAHEARVVRLCAGLSGPERRQLHARRAKLKASVSSSARSAVA
jgi:DNA-binding MarR family transcriptional regulator